MKQSYLAQYTCLARWFGRDSREEACVRCTSCGKPATGIYELTGAPLCGRHMASLRRNIVTLIEDTDQIVKRLAQGYLPEMREHDESMLRRITDQEIDVSERVELRMHLTARKIAAHVALDEKHALVVA